MKILLYDMGAYTQNDLTSCLKARGVAYRSIYYRCKDIYQDDFFCRRFEKYLCADDYACVLSINFFPLVATICHKHGIPYISWSYDSPLSYKKHPYFHFPTNRIYLFDRIECEMLEKQGFQTVHHLPLGINTARLDQSVPTATDAAAYSCDVSMVGTMYQSQLPEIIAPLSAYDRGYIDAIVCSQALLYGCYMAEELITDVMLQRIRQAHERIGQEIEIDAPELSIAIATRIAGIERRRLLEEMGGRFGLHLYSRHVDTVPQGVTYHGTVRYFDEMPKVFKLSRININPTLKSIRSGIPLRALDILGCGGLLLSNYQHELVEYFVPGEEVVVYESIEDAGEKADFYLRHDDERRRVAANGYRKVCERFSFDGQLARIFAEAGLG